MGMNHGNIMMLDGFLLRRILEWCCGFWWSWGIAIMGPLVRLVTISLTILVILNWFNLAKCDNVVVSTYRTYFLDDICIQFELITASVVWLFSEGFLRIWKFHWQYCAKRQPGLCLGNSWDSNNFKNMRTIWHMKFKTGTRRDSRSSIHSFWLRTGKMNWTWETLYINLCVRNGNWLVNAEQDTQATRLIITIGF